LSSLLYETFSIDFLLNGTAQVSFDLRLCRFVVVSLL
jgi:hypothetical protein